MNKLSVTVLLASMLTVFANAASSGENDSSKEIAEIIGPVLGTYVKMQDAYFLDAEKIGSFNYIGFVIPRDVPYVEFGESESPKGLFVTVKNTIGKCSAGRKIISITPYTENGGHVLKYKCASAAGCESLYPNLKYVCQDEMNLDASSVEEGIMKDSRDGKAYKTVKFSNVGQTWMAENLNYKIDGSRCLLDKKANCKKYGRLYTWNAAMKACPTGWRVPDSRDWIGLFIEAGWDGEKEGPKGEILEIGEKLKSKNGWRNNGNGTDDLKFTAQPGGLAIVSKNMFLEDAAAFWSSFESSRGDVLTYWVTFVRDDVLPAYGKKDDFLSVRCVKDE